MFGCPILNRTSFAGPAAKGAPISGPTLSRNYPNGARVANRGWKRPFDDPIPLPRGRHFITLQDTGDYITKLPKAEHTTAEWQAAMEALILVARLGGPTSLRASAS
jgi:hypothetical protein